MKKFICIFFLSISIVSISYSQERITKEQLKEMAKYNKEANFFSDDTDFEENKIPTNWQNESAVILCQKTNFEFDKKGISVGQRIKNNLIGLLLAPVTFGATVIAVNTHNPISILVEETERRKILLNDKYAVELYSILYFRFESAGDAFAARVIKKDGSITNISLEDAVKVEGKNVVPSLFTSYTESKKDKGYKGGYFKLAVADLEEGDIIEYAYRHYNNSYYSSSMSYLEFDPVYYVCNRSLPVKKQIIEILTQNNKYYLSYKNLKGAPEFSFTQNGDKKTYRWVDSDRERMVDTRYVNEYLELPSVKFQVSFAKEKRKEFVWFKNEDENKKDLTPEEFAEKAMLIWHNMKTVQNNKPNLSGSIDNLVSDYYKELKKKGLTENTDEEFAKKVYYYLRARTLYFEWDDLDFAKLFSGILGKQKIDHEIVVTTYNSQTSIEKACFAQEISWMVKINNKYYCNPYQHKNPEEFSPSIAGNTAAKFHYNNQEVKPKSLVLPITDTLSNIITYNYTVSLEPTAKANLDVQKTVDARNFMKNELIDEVLALTPYVENDYKNYDGTSLWEDLSEKMLEKATNELNKSKKEWREEKPKFMKYLNEAELNCTIEKYNSFKLNSDGRSYKKKVLNFSESFTIQNFTSSANSDIILPLPKLVGGQTKIKKEEKNRQHPIDTRYPRALVWNISMPIPEGYIVKGIDGLNKRIDNECGSFASVAKVENNTIYFEVKKVYKNKNFESNKWPQLMAVLDAAYNFSQAKLILRKNNP